MGDAAHTAHFAIGSGTKLAIDDAIELAKQFNEIGHGVEAIPSVLSVYEEIRRVDVARIQNAARNAMEWFEVVGRRYADSLEPEQFMYFHADALPAHQPRELAPARSRMARRL